MNMTKEEALAKIEELKKYVEGKEKQNPFFTYLVDVWNKPHKPKIYDDNIVENLEYVYGKKIAEDMALEVWQNDVGNIFLRLKNNEE